MSVFRYALEAGRPKRLEVHWQTGWTRTVLRLDGEKLGMVHGEEAILEGRTFSLPDGSELAIRLERKYGDSELVLTRDGEPLPGTQVDAAYRVYVSAAIIFVLAALFAIQGFLGFGDDAVFGQAPIGFACAAGFVVMGVFVLRRSRSALVAALAAVANLTLLVVVQFIEAEMYVDAARVFLPDALAFILLWRGLDGLKALEEKAAGTTAR